MSRRALVALALAAIALGLWLLWPKHRLTDEQRLRAIISSCAKAASDHQLAGVMKPVSRRYRGDFGDRAELRDALRYMLFATPDLKVAPANVKVAIAGTTAKVDFVAMLARVGGSGATGNIGSRFIHVDFEKSKGAWKAVGAKSRDATAKDLVP